jgi:propanol-preferring alcohol dehydrogenase
LEAEFGGGPVAESGAIQTWKRPDVVSINAIHLDRMPEFDYDTLLWGERQMRSGANMTRADARDFLALAADIGLRPLITEFPLENANEALAAVIVIGS